jgi:hypothetical protein
MMTPEELFEYDKFENVVASDPIVYQCWTLIRRRKVSVEEGLIQMVIALSADRKRLADSLCHMSERMAHPLMILVPEESNEQR